MKMCLFLPKHINLLSFLQLDFTMKILKRLMVVGLLTSSASVLAHSDMMHTVPKDGAMFMEPVDHIELNFGDPVRLVKFSVINSKNEPVETDFAIGRESKANFSISLPALGSDQYQVKWMIVGGDGHKMTGSFGFMQH